MTFIANPQHDLIGVDLPLGISEIPWMNRTAFQNAVARTRMVIGLGDPVLSPTPWEALCLGVPFLNPIKGWRAEAPEDRSEWSSAQHDGVFYLGVDEPFVYHVRIGDRAGIEAAVKKATETPVER